MCKKLFILVVGLTLSSLNASAAPCELTGSHSWSDLQRIELSSPRAGLQVGPVPGQESIIYTPNGIFIGALHEAPDPKRPYDAPVEILVSRDLGRTFTTLLKRDGLTTTVPYLVRAGDDVIAVLPNLRVKGDATDNRGILYRFGGASNAKVAEFGIPSSGNKGALLWDKTRGLLYHAPRTISGALPRGGSGLSFETIDPGTGRVLSPLVRTFQSIPPNDFERNVLVMGGNDLFFAWGTYYGVTSSESGALRWENADIRFAKSGDGGRSWKKLDGTPIAMPFIVDRNSTQTDSLVAPDFRGNKDINYLARALGTGRYLYFLYTHSRTGAPTTGVLERYNIARKTFDLRNTNVRGETFVFNNSKTELAAVTRGPNSLLAISFSRSSRPDGAQGWYLIVAGSNDDGQSWHDFAVSNPLPDNIEPQFVQVAHDVLPDGSFVGTVDMYERANNRARSFITFRLPTGCRSRPSK